MDQLTQVLEATLSPDTQVIQLAQQQLEQAAQANLGVFMTALSTELADVGKSEVARMAAGLQLKNYLTAKNPEARLQRQQAWFSLDPQIRAHVKTLVLRTLGTETRHGSAAQCVAYIAAVDLPTAQWPEVMQVLLANITSAQATEALKEASLQAIGYICEELDPKLLASQANEILTAIVQGMRKEEPSNAVRLAATTALLNSLEFTKANFEKESERHFIMQVVCEATQCISVPVQVAALQCLVKIMSLYYVYMESYMGPALFAITLEAMKSNVNEVALQGIEFWSSVCDEEADLAIEAAEAAAEGRPPENISRFYVKGAASYLVPILLLTLTKQEEYDDEDDWNPCKAAGVCLSLMASCCEDEIVPHVTPFVKAHITNEEWRFRDAAIMALGSILEGPDPNVLQSPVSELTETLIGLMNDPMVQVKDSAVWTIGRVCEQIPAAVLNDQCLLLLLQALVAGLAGEPRVAINACWALSSLAEAAYDMAGTTDNDEEPETFCLSTSYGLLVTKLISAADRPDAGAGNLRNSAYQALMDLIKYSAKDCYEVIQGTTMEMMKRLQQVLQIDSQRSGAERQELVDLECLLCATLQSLLRKVNQDDAMKIAETVMSVLLMILQSSSTQQGGGVHEDAIQTVGVLVEAIGKDFAKYMESFAPFLKHALKNALEYQVCIAAVGLVGDLCRALMDQMLPYCDDIMTIMVENLSHAAVHRSVKPPILSAIGDIALAIGPEFKKYLPIVFNILQQAANLQEQLDKSDFDLLDYINELRDGCLEAYTGIIQGLKGDDEKHLNPDVKLAEPQVPFMVQFIGYIANDEERSESNVANSVGLLGDLVVAFGKPMVDVVSNTPGVLKMLQEGKISRNKRTKALANWASKEIKSQQKQRTD